jgi:hypothetical protein
MPIDYKKYPKNWKSEIRPYILNRANHCCEDCGVKNHDTGFRGIDGHFYNDNFIIQQLDLYGIDMFDKHISEKAKHFKIVLTVAHLDHNLSNNDYSNLKALCQKCHLNYDKEHHSKNRRKTIKSKKKLVELQFP